MLMHVHKKLIIVIAIAVGALIITSGVIGAVLSINRQVAPEVAVAPAPQDSDPTKQEAETTPDLSVDLGACTVVDFATIQSALGNVVTTIQPAINRGVGRDQFDGQSQSCIYGFTTEDTTNDRLTITVAQFASESIKGDAVAGYKDIAASVASIGEQAYFLITTDKTTVEGNPYPVDRRMYELSFFDGLKLYTFTITQPAADDALTAQTAQAALEVIARSI